MTRICSFDLSLTSTGVCNDGALSLLEPPKTFSRGIDRLRWIRAQVLHRVAGADLCVLESYAFGRIQQAHHLGELGGVVRVALADADIRFVDIAPSSLKMFATGKGNASKDEVLASVIRRYAYAGHSKDEADSLVLWHMAQAHYGTTGAPLNEAQRKALAKIEWPAVGAPVVPGQP